MNHKIKLKGTLRTYLRWPLFLTALLVIADIHMYTVNPRAGLVGAAYSLLFVLAALMIFFTGRKGVQRDLVQFAQNYASLQMKMMQEMALPFAVLSVDGHLLWGNDDFVKIVVNKKAARRNIANIFPEITQDKLPEGNEDVMIHVTNGEKAYRAVLRKIQATQMAQKDGEKGLIMDQLVDDETFIVMFLYDETDMLALIRAREAENLMVGLLYIDNYDEMLSSIDDVRQSLLSALIERRINKYMQEIDAISKKLEKDKFLFVFKQKYLDELKNDRFSILEEVRAINIGNDQTCTISIGIGLGHGSFTERYEWARAAMDLALGRGGDQAVIKNGDNEEFYGGKRVQIERNTRVKARVKAHALKEQIEGKERVIVMGHSIGDVDSFGASVGIYRIAHSLARRAHIVLGDCDSSVKQLQERFYTKEYEADMIVDGDTAKELMDDNTLLVIVDVNKANYTECPELIDMAQSVVVIDHHRQAGKAIDKAVLFYIEPYASSASEMVAEISQYIGSGLKLRPAEAEAMYAGVMLDTNCFTDKIGARTFEAMAYLRRSGADVVRIRKLFREDIEEYRIRAEAIRNTEIYLDGYAIAVSGTENVESPTVLGAKIANSLLDIKGVKASFVLTDYNKRVYISARSIDEVNVQVMMERLGGGGHINMAGAQLTDCSVDAAKEVIRQMLDKMIADGDIV